MPTKKDALTGSLRQVALKYLMLKEANLILLSVDFLEAQIETVSLEIDRAELHHNWPEVKRLQVKLLGLLAKLNRETVYMDEYMVKYKRILDDEEKALLYGFSKKKQVSVRCVPTNPGRAQESQSLPKASKK